MVALNKHSQISGTLIIQGAGVRTEQKGNKGKRDKRNDDLRVPILAAARI